MTGRPAGLDGIDDWLVAQGLLATPVEEVLEGLSRRLIDVGVPLVRAHISGTTLHPLYEAMGATWSAADGVTSEGHVHGSSQTGTDWLTSSEPLAGGHACRVEVGVIVQSPFRAKYDDVVAAHATATGKDDETAGR